MNAISSRKTYAEANSSSITKNKNKIKTYARSSLYKNKGKKNIIYKNTSKSKINTKKSMIILHVIWLSLIL